MWLEQRRVAEKTKSSKGLAHVQSWLFWAAVAVGCGRGSIVSVPADGGRRDVQGGGDVYVYAESGESADSSVADIALVADAASDVPAGTDSVVSRKPLAAACSSAAECASGFCADGICCQSSCAGLCQTCSIPSSIGTCTFVAAGASSSRTTDCPASAPSSCGETGLCDGEGGCLRPPKGALCAPASCSGGVLTPSSVCDGAGTCVHPPALGCGPYGCAASGYWCNRGCPGGDSICPSGAYCTGDEECVSKKASGNACAGDHECLSGHCANQVCCESVCNGPCESCNQRGSMGQCKPLFAVDGGLSCGISLDAGD